jgi:hypothetical protein
MEREPLKKVSVGGTGVGKTFQNKKFIDEEYSNPRNPNARKTLIYDTNLEFKDVTPLAVQDIPKFNRQQAIEVRRILPLDPDTRAELGMDAKYDLLCEIVDHYQFKNGLLYLEDINNYVTSVANQKHLINLLTTNRHKLLDIFINLQTFRALPPRVWGNINVLQIHKTNDSPFQSKIQDQISGHMEVLRIAHTMVDTKTRVDPRFFVILDMRTSKITGSFSIEDFVEASKRYLSLNQKKLKNYMKMHNVSQETAQERLIGDFMYQYNGNVKLKK